MTTAVVLTGTGVHHPRPGRAGAGVLSAPRRRRAAVRRGPGDGPAVDGDRRAVHRLTALFVTHVHRDHVVDLPDVAMTRWIGQQLAPTAPLVVVTPTGVTERVVRRMLEPDDDDVRRGGYEGTITVGEDLARVVLGA